MTEFTVSTSRTYREGYGVAVNLIYTGEDDGPERISDVDVSVVRIAADVVQLTRRRNETR